jgi:hypothetical protein
MSLFHTVHDVISMNVDNYANLGLVRCKMIDVPDKNIELAVAEMYSKERRLILPYI